MPKPSTPPQPPIIPWSRAKSLIRTGDIGLLRATGRFGRWIGRVGGCDLVHSMMFGRDGCGEDGRLLKICEQVRPKGRLMLADEYMDGLPPGTVEVFRPKKCLGYNGKLAFAWMLENIPGLPYPGRSIIRFFLAKLPFLRWHVRASTDDSGNGLHDLVCSGAIARACRVAGGIDLVPRLSDAWTEPRDLYHSAAMDQLLVVGEAGNGG